MLVSADTAFNYGSLAVDVAASARAAAERIRGRLNAAFIETGRELLVQKAALGHGHFLPWIEAEFGMSERSARNLMSVAEYIDSNRQDLAVLEGLSAHALTALAAPSTPPEVRAEVIERASSGEKVTAKEIEELKAKLKRAKALVDEKESQRKSQESFANIAEKKASSETSKRMFAEAAKEKLSREVEDLKEEIRRLKEDGTIHVIAATAEIVEPEATIKSSVSDQMEAAKQAWLSKQMREFHSVDDDWREDLRRFQDAAFPRHN